MTACSAPSGESGSNGEGTANMPVEKREYNYITGEALKDADFTERPVAIMVDNSKYAQPQYGINKADIIYEMVTEGGITRLMAVFSDLDDVEYVGPVRSARDQFVQFVLPLNAIYVHIGCSIYASNMLNAYNYQDIDGLYLGVTSFDFDREREKTYAHEHCWFTKANLIRDGISATGINTTGNLYPAFNFADYKKDPVTFENGEDATDIALTYSDYTNVAFHYNQADGRYYKDNYGTAHIDAATGEQISFDNVFLLHTIVSLYEDGLCTSFDLSQGDGYYFYGGKYIPVLWEKGAPENPLKITDLEGNLIEVNCGKSYVGIFDSSMLGTLNITGAVQDVESSSDIQSSTEG